MHKAIYILLFFLTNSCFAQEAWTDKSRVLPDILREIPVKLFVTHSPNPNYPELNEEGEKGDSKYVWKHATTVCSPIEDLKVVKAGSFIWYDETGWKENLNYSKNDFVKNFECPKGEIQNGACFTFEENYRYGNMLYGGDALWYVIAEDKDGKLYKGIGLIETESTLQNK